MSNPPNEPPRFVTCRCQHCDGGIEFDASEFGGGETVSVNCPHCQMDMNFIVPPIPPQILPPPLLAVQRKKRLGSIVFLGICFACIVLGVMGVFLFSVLAPETVTWEKSDTIKQGDVEIKILSAASGMLFMENGEGLGVTPTQNYFLIKIRVTNLNPDKTVDFSTWRSGSIWDKSGATLCDNFGNAYKRIVFDRPLMNCRDESTIYPNQSFTDTLIFEFPVQNYQWLHLSLDANNFGGSGTLRFEISN